MGQVSGYKDTKNPVSNRLEAMAKKNIMKVLKRAVSPLSQRSACLAQSPPAHSPPATPFTRYVLDNLGLDSHDQKLLAMSFAPQIQTDCDAKVLDFDDYFHLLGTEKRNALRVLNRTIPAEERLLLRSEQKSGGRHRDVYLLSINQIEEVLLAANTEEGKRWRKLVLRIKNLVMQYMKQEMEEEKGKLAIEEARRTELEAAHSVLTAALTAEKERRSALKALREAEDEPQQTAYLMQSGVFRTYVKIGKTGDEGDKRKRELQTGNPEEITVLAESKCVDAKLVEKNLHHVFRWYKRRGEWYEIDKQRAIYVMRLFASLLDGLRREEHESVDIVDACREILSGHNLEAPKPPEAGYIEQDDARIENEEDVWTGFRSNRLKRHPHEVCGWTAVKTAFFSWFKTEFGEGTRLPGDKIVKDYMTKHLGCECRNHYLRGEVKTTRLGWKGWQLVEPSP